MTTKSEILLDAINEKIAKEGKGRVEKTADGVLFASLEDSKHENKFVWGREFESLAEKYVQTPIDSQSAFIEMILMTYTGKAEIPTDFETASLHVLPQLWSLKKINEKQAALGSTVRLLWCGIHGEPEEEAVKLYDIGVVVVYEIAGQKYSSASPILSSNLQEWQLNFVEVLRRALANLRERTKGDTQNWKRHESGAICFAWEDHYNAARAAIFPSLAYNALKKESKGAVLATFPLAQKCMATTARNAIGACYIGDHSFVAGAELSFDVYRLAKVKVGKTSTTCHHPLRQKAGEGLIWQWSRYSPCLTSGEFCVPRTQDQVERILSAIESNSALPVFGNVSDEQTTKRKVELATDFKSRGNIAFADASRLKDALRFYQNGISILDDSEHNDQRTLFFSDANEAYKAKILLAALQANAAAVLVKLAEKEDNRDLAALALRHSMRSVQILPEYAKGHHRCAAAFRFLGEVAAADASDTAAAEITARQRSDKQDAISAITNARNAIAKKKQIKAEAARKKKEKENLRKQEHAQAKTVPPLPPGAGPTLINLGDDTNLTSLGLMPPSLNSTDYSLLSSLPPTTTPNFSPGLI